MKYNWRVWLYWKRWRLMIRRYLNAGELFVAVGPIRVARMWKKP